MKKYINEPSIKYKTNVVNFPFREERSRKKFDIAKETTTTKYQYLVGSEKSSLGKWPAVTAAETHSPVLDWKPIVWGLPAITSQASHTDHKEI